MSTFRRVILAGTLALFVVAGVVAWNYWPVALRYRKGRTLEAGRATVSRYLSGQDSLSAAVCELAMQVRHFNTLSLRLDMVEPAQTRRIVDEPLFVPSGVDSNDPRVEELTRNAYRIAVPEELPSEQRARIRQLDDSIIRARGFRIVECAA